jgi:hypothetical protein
VAAQQIDRLQEERAEIRPEDGHALLDNEDAVREASLKTLTPLERWRHRTVLRRNVTQREFTRIVSAHW